MFERSKSGQQNRSRFFGTSFVCYVEGREDGEQAHDISFWRAVLGSLRPSIQIKFVPRGGKPILEGLAREVIEKDIENVIVAMDADYDHLTSDVISDPRVFYTYGYSWENDAFSRQSLKEVYRALCHCGTVPSAVAAEIDAVHARVARQLRWPVQADLIALRAGSSVLPRQSPGRVIKAVPGSFEPGVDNKEVRKLITEAKRRRKASLGSVRVKDTPRFCVGHVYELAMIYILKMVAKAFGGKSSLSPDHVRDVCLQTLPVLLRPGGGAIRDHHEAQCARIM